MREGIFSEDDLNQLENGYSVSETDDERTHIQDNDILSLRSGLSGVGPMPNHNADEGVDTKFAAGLMNQANYGVNSEAVLLRQGELEG